MNNTDTRNRLLDAAECLFARHGIEGASLRSITAEAGANLAAIHYHFGSREALIQAVFARRLEPLNRERLRLLDAVEAGDAPPALEAILKAFIAPALRLGQDPAHGGREFMCLMGRLWAEQGEMTRAIVEQFDDVFRRFTAALSRALPHLSRPELLWRFFFTLGSMGMPLFGTDIIKQRTGGLCDPSDVEATFDRLVAFVAGGLRAPVPGGVGHLHQGVKTS